MKLYRLIILEEGQVIIDRVVTRPEIAVLVTEHAGLINYAHLFIYLSRCPHKRTLELPDGKFSVEVHRLSV
ncbi:hypothetical protein [Rhizobium laguerreae]|uniref:hypothetical protein n=1 Tax=Rhizobium laguerreae TaxID=1076926 RepID=UPI00197D2899|nr:hypothetical protein [Rhizobium laguerreae]